MFQLQDRVKKTKASAEEETTIEDTTGDIKIT